MSPLLEKVRISREDHFIKNKKLSDITYVILYLLSKKNGNYRKVIKKDINYSKLGEIYKTSRQTIAKRIKELVAEGIIHEYTDHYIIPNPEYYYDIDAETARVIINTLKENTVKIYVYLLGWSNHCAERNEQYNFSFDHLCEVIGYTKQQTSNRDQIKDIINILERLGLIKISPADFPIIINGIKTYHHRLLWAQDKLPNKNSAF
mgnify:CR=1 FL=1